VSAYRNFDIFLGLVIKTLAEIRRMSNIYQSQGSEMESLTMNLLKHLPLSQTAQQKSV